MHKQEAQLITVNASTSRAIMAGVLVGLGTLALGALLAVDFNSSLVAPTLF